MGLRTIDMTPDRQHQQTMAVVSLVMQAIGRHIPDDGHSLKHAHHDLFEALQRAGIDFITNEHRVDARLPPRGPHGWTREELHILEARRMQAMLAPLPVVFPLSTFQRDGER